jgi:hypothetical protein
MGRGAMMQGMQNPQIMEPMSLGKLTPEDQKKMADMMKMMEQQQKPEQPKK